MEFTVKIFDEDVVIDATRDEIQGAEPDVGIMHAFVASFRGHRLENGKLRELTIEEYDSISEEENDRICDALTESYYEEEPF